MPLGDSITAGYTDNPTWNVPFGFGYRSGLYTRLTNANYPFQYVGGSPRNRGTGRSVSPSTFPLPTCEPSTRIFTAVTAGWTQAI